MTRPDHYATLGVPKDASLADIKRAYRALAREAHPDNGGSTERMQALNAAKEVLYDAQRRADYDAGGEGSLDPIEVKARELIMGLFMEAISGNVLNPYQSSLGGLRKGIGEGHASIRTQHLAIGRLAQQRGLILARKGDKNAYNDIVDAAIKAANDSIDRYEKQIQVAELAIKLLQEEYKPAPPPSIYPAEPFHGQGPFVAVGLNHDRFKF